MKRHYQIILFIAATMWASVAHAQSSGELENVEIEIVKERNVTLPEAERKFTKIAPFASEPISPPITYSFKPIEVQLPLANLTVRPLKLKKEADALVHRGQVSAAYGNFASPYLEAYVTSPRNAKQLMGAHALMDIWARGPVDDENSGNGTYGVSLFANSFGSKHRAGAYVNVDQSFWHFYGYPDADSPSAKDVRQRFTRFLTGGTLASATTTNFQYQTNASFGYLSDRFDAKESKVDVAFSSVYKTKTSRKLRTSAEYQLISRQDALVEAKPRHLLQAQGTYVFEPIEKLTLEAGLSLAYENDTIDKDFHIYPRALASYQVSKRVRAHASLTGQLHSVSLHSLTTENPWLAPNTAINHTNEALALSASVEAQLARNLQASAGASVASLRNLYFYKNASADAATFELQYDKGATTRTNLFAMLTYAQSQTTNFSLRADWFGYATDTLAAAWHRPAYQVELHAAHNFYKKVKVTPALAMLGGMRAFDDANSATITLDPAIDLSLRVDYFISEKALLFIQGANLLSAEYPLYYRYPVRGVQVRVGLSWSF